MKKKMSYMHIHSRYVKNRLVNDFGHMVQHEERNKKDSKYWIYLFEKTPKLLSDWTIITKEIKNQKIK